jgi:hypothetical protein
MLQTDMRLTLMHRIEEKNARPGPGMPAKIRENRRLIHHRKTGASLAKHASAWWRRQGRGNGCHGRDGQHSDVVVGICTLASTPCGLMASCQRPWERVRWMIHDVPLLR